MKKTNGILFENFGFLYISICDQKANKFHKKTCFKAFVFSTRNNNVYLYDNFLGLKELMNHRKFIYSIVIK